MLRLLTFQLRDVSSEETRALNWVRLAAIHAEWPAWYQATQIDAWCAGLRPEYYSELSYGHDVVIASTGRQITGFAHVDAICARLVGLYVLPGHTRRGLGTALLEKVEKRARRLGVAQLDLDSSLAAEGFYRRRGYLGAADVELRLSGDASIRVAQLHKALARVPGQTTHP